MGSCIFFQRHWVADTSSTCKIIKYFWYDIHWFNEQGSALQLPYSNVNLNTRGSTAIWQHLKVSAPLEGKLIYFSALLPLNTHCSLQTRTHTRTHTRQHSLMHIANFSLARVFFIIFSFIYISLFQVISRHFIIIIDLSHQSTSWGIFFIFCFCPVFNNPVFLAFPSGLRVWTLKIVWTILFFIVSICFLLPLPHSSPAGLTQPVFGGLQKNK